MVDVGEFLDKNGYPYSPVNNELGIRSIVIKPYDSKVADKDSWISDLSPGNSWPVELELNYEGSKQSEYILRGIFNKKGKDSGSGNSQEQTKWWYFDFYQILMKSTSIIPDSPINISGNSDNPYYVSPVDSDNLIQCRQ